MKRENTSSFKIFLWNSSDSEVVKLLKFVKHLSSLPCIQSDLQRVHPSGREMTPESTNSGYLWSSVRNVVVEKLNLERSSCEITRMIIWWSLLNFFLCCVLSLRLHDTLAKIDEGWNEALIWDVWDTLQHQHRSNCIPAIHAANAIKKA